MDHRIFFLKSYPQKLGGPNKDLIQMIARSSTFDNSSINRRFYAYLNYDKNNNLTVESKKEIEIEISQSVRDSIFQASRK